MISRQCAKCATEMVSKNISYIWNDPVEMHILHITKEIPAQMRYRLIGFNNQANRAEVKDMQTTEQSCRDDLIDSWVSEHVSPNPSGRVSRLRSWELCLRATYRLMQMETSGTLPNGIDPDVTNDEIKAAMKRAGYQPKDDGQIVHQYKILYAGKPNRKRQVRR